MKQIFFFLSVLTLLPATGCIVVPEHRHGYYERREYHHRYGYGEYRPVPPPPEPGIDVRIHAP